MAYEQSSSVRVVQKQELVKKHIIEKMKGRNLTPDYMMKM